MNTNFATRTAGVTLVTAAVLGGVVGGVAVAAGSGSGSPAPSAVQVAATSTPTSTPTGTPKAHHRRALAARALHGSFTVTRKGKPSVLDVQRGTVSRGDASSVTVRSTDGFEATYKLASTTHIRKDKKPATAAALPAGTKVAVVVDDAGGSPVARVIRVAG